MIFHNLVRWVRKFPIGKINPQKTIVPQIDFHEALCIALWMSFTLYNGNQSIYTDSTNGTSTLTDLQKCTIDNQYYRTHITLSNRLRECFHQDS